MNRTLTRFLLAGFSILVFSFLLTPAGPLGAQGRGPNSLQPDSSAVIFTMVIQRNEPVSRGNFLILPSPNSHASINAKGGSSGGGGGTKGGGGGGSTGGGTSPCCGGGMNLSFGPLTSAYTAGSVQAPSTTQLEAEEEIAVDPTDANNLVAAISDFSSSSGYNNTKWFLSKDGGGSWAFQNFVPTNSSGLLVTNNGSSVATWDANSDPVLAFDRSDNVYLADLYLNIDSYGRITGEGFYVSANTFSILYNSGNFGTPDSPNTYPVWTNLNNGSTFTIEDKPWITVDNGTSATSHPGYVYASWSHFTGCQNKYSALYGGYVLTCSSDSIYFSYSTDSGHTWSQGVQISPSTQDGAVQGSQPAVGPDGTVYVAYEFFGSNNQRQQNLAVGTWSGGTLTFPTSTQFPASPVFSELTFAGCSTCTSSYRVNSFPNIAVSPGGSGAGSVYLVYGAQANSTSTAHVNFMACTANCTTSSAFYSSALPLDDNAAGEHFFPAIAVDSNGVIHTSWFDTRNAPNTVPNPDDYLDVYGSYLNYNGTDLSGAPIFTASANARVTPATYDASILDGWGDTSFIGDYIGIAAAPNTAFPVWTNMAGALGYPTRGSLQTNTLTVPTP